jgi:hypothetical protein
VGRGIGWIVLVAAIGAACNSLNGSGDLDVGAAAPDAATDGVASNVPPPPPPPGVQPPPSDAGTDGAGFDAGTKSCDRAGDPSLVLCVPFEGDVLDHSTMPLVATPSASMTFGPGQVGQGGVFATGGVVYTFAAKLMTFPRVTITAFILPAVLPADGRAGIVDSDSRFGMFAYQDGSAMCIGGAGPTSTLRSITKLQKGAWTHVACVAGGGDVRVYLDGVLDNTMTVPNGIGDIQSNIAIGMNAPSGENFIGVIDEVRVYNRELSTGEIVQASKGK